MPPTVLPNFWIGHSRHCAPLALGPLWTRTKKLLRQPYQPVRWRWAIRPERLVLWSLNHWVKKDSRDRPESETRGSVRVQFDGEFSWIRARRPWNCGKRISTRSLPGRIYTLDT